MTHARSKVIVYRVSRTSTRKTLIPVPHSVVTRMACLWVPLVLHTLRICILVYTCNL